MANQADTYTTEAIACGLSDVAGWLENEVGRDKHARTIRLGVARLRELGAAAQPGEADRVGLGELAARFEAKREECMRQAVRWPAQSSKYWTHITGANAFAEARDMARADAAGHVVPASLAALGTGEGSGGASLDDRLHAAGMFTVPEMMGTTPLSRWSVHSGMTDLKFFGEWLDRKTSEYTRMRAAYELGDKDKTDELYEWVLAHSAAFSSIRENFKVATLTHPQAPNTLSEVEENATLRSRATAAEDTLKDREAEIERLTDRADELKEALWWIAEWSEAYPLTIFPEPDLKKARVLLEAGGVTLDSISAHCMRHVVEGVGKIASAALFQPDPSQEPGTGG